jgi:hypothetical protein
MRLSAFRKSWRFCLGALAGSLLPVAAHAASIDLGTYQLQPDTPNQQVQIFVGGGEAIKGVTLSIYTGDGGPDIGAKIAAPEITAVDLFSDGSIFSGNNSGYLVNQPVSLTAGAKASQVWEASTQTQSGTVTLGTVNSTSLLAVLTIDTTGFKSGKYALAVDNAASPTLFSTSSGAAVVPTVTDGVLEINNVTGFVTPDIPEPASLGLLGLCVPALLLRRRTRQVAV